ncbi:spermidine synthase [Nonomuraea sp. NPDC049695]|uniref:spermidine synthase n=1 Tax=Nonomuraea sp. NPDC049695 TaxID=3154734 RepID=UPI0034317904
MTTTPLATTTSSVTEVLASGLTRRWEIDPLFAARTTYQQMLIGRTAQGVTLFCGDDDSNMERQSAELSQLTYHEALIVPPLALASQLFRVLIIGSSEGVATQIALQAGAAHVDHVDIDLECVEACAEHLPYGYSPADVQAALAKTGRAHLHAQDGHRFVQERLVDGTRYDVIVIDLPDESPGSDAQHNRLYAVDFLMSCKDLLAPGGVVSTQAGCPTLWRQKTLRTSLDRFKTLFPSVLCFSSWEHEWAFVTSSPDASRSLPAELQQRLPHLAYQPRTMDAASVASAVVLPYHVANQDVRPWASA